MSATKGTIRAQIVQQIKRQLMGGGAADFKFDYREIDLAMNQVRDTLVKNDFFARYAQGDMQVDLTYVHEYRNVAADLDTDINEFTSELPCNVISLPNGREIFQIRPMKDSTNDFIPVRPNFNSMYRNNGDVPLESRKGYYKTAGTLYYVNVTAADMPCKMLMRLVAAGQDLPDDAEYIGGDLELQLVNGVIALFTQGMNKPKDTNDTDLIN